ncbi:uncharacterized protein AMSG_05458 [Thecamonas trahens ATCC 50062]|uniref:Uncharacterized protein n=1 Tax=Thecamonas trahens ATCC 50062 TaxID=461836 RepID=A0A0L0DBF9_THETB|nr:hypothetical protein AMSG_05458 [Thecamonas trahens ATCC 50062]KNC49451.1 hypothetical protein AMSG_05458 [Thecamonas trahens ATCC 50062]|eukprot:XP_013757871.1 hypothetical protein AMSG_05458 [Thecamonas trahens ATCC 50062]
MRTMYQSTVFAAVACLLLAASASAAIITKTATSSTFYGSHNGAPWSGNRAQGAHCCGASQHSQYRIFYGFNLNIPSGHAVDGIQVSYEYISSTTGFSACVNKDITLRTTSGSVILSSNAKTGSSYFSSGTISKGSSTDTWGLSGSASSIRSALNSGTFGVAVRATGFAEASSSSGQIPLAPTGGDSDGSRRVSTRAPTVGTWRVDVYNGDVTIKVWTHQLTCGATGPWPTTNAGSTATLGCSSGYTGSRTRYCTTSGSWQSESNGCTLVTNYCSLLTAPSNGILTASCSSKRSLGEVCGTFQCNSGYQLSGSASRTCNAGPSWSGSAASCVKITNYCSLLTAPSNGYITSGSCSAQRSIGESCGTFQCNGGYSRSGDASRTCNAGPSWSGSTASCGLITNYCPLLTAPANGIITTSCTSKRSVGESCGNFQCNGGYQLSGSMSRTCQSNAAWGGSAASCSPIPDYCPPPPAAPSNGVQGSCSRTVGGTCSYSCNTGYNPGGGMTITCQSNGAWSGSPAACNPTADYCPALTAPTNGNAPASYSRTITSVASPYTCNAGYDLSGSASRTCQSDGTWSSTTPTCVLDTSYCGARPATPANGNAGSCGYSIGASCTYGCNNGYEPTGSMTVTCNSGGAWSGSPASCGLKTNYCPALTNPTNGQDPSSYSRVLGAVASPYTCNSGYIVTAGSTSRTCMANSAASGVWSGTTPTCSIDNAHCSTAPAPPPNFFIDTCSAAQFGECIYKCNNGYTRSGGDRYTCQPDTSWGGSLGTCSLTNNYCPALTIPANSNRGACSGQLGSICGPVTCNAGYSISGSASRTCEDAGVSAGIWSGTATSCALITNYCTLPSTPSNGVLGACTRSIGGSCTYTCGNGYETSGTTTITCQSGPTWSGSFGTCVKTSGYCPVESAPANGVAGTGCTGQIGTLCGPASCNAGYNPSGTATRTCNANNAVSGTWSGTTLTCAIDPAYCTTPAAPANGAIGSCPLSIGSSCTASCSNGYSTGGLTSVTCEAGPAWSGVFGACSKYAGYCGALPQPSNGVIPGCTGMLGSSCGAASCNAGYNLAGDATRNCIDNGPGFGSWTGTSVSCNIEPNHCTPPPAPANGALGTCITSIGGSCSYTCDNGYEVSGTGTITCSAGPTWSTSFGTCVKSANYCPAHPPLADGSNPSCTGEIDEVCGTFTCNSGFDIVGSAERTCLNNGPITGIWSGTAPSCQVDNDYCPSGPAPPANGVKGSCARYLGGTCEYSCNAGYTNTGSSSLTCTSGKTWLGASPNCVPYNDYCPPKTSIEYGNAPVCNNRINEVCGTFTCNPPFAIFGEKDRTCGPDGDWIGDEPFCSSTDVSKSLVYSAQFITVSADGPGWRIEIEPRTASNDTLAESQDFPSVLLASTPPSVEAPSVAPAAVWSAAKSRFLIELTPQVVATYSLNILLNGVVIGASPYTLVVEAGVPAAPTTFATGRGLGIVVTDDDLFPQNEVVRFAVFPHDQHGNVVPMASNPATTPYVATLKGAGFAEGDVPIVYLAGESGPTTGYVYEYSVPIGGLLTLSVTLDGLAIADSPWLVQVRAICEPGKQALQITGPCVPCEKDSYSAPDGRECLLCPDFMTSPSSSGSIGNCTCVRGYFENLAVVGADPSKRQCDACPVGASCAGGNARPIADPGYHQVGDEFVSCPQPSACLGAGQCARGYKGASCTDCVSGYYRLGDRCYKCNKAQAAFIATGIAFLLLLFVAALVYLNTRESHNRMYTAAAFMIGFNSLQISAMYGEIDLRWHPVAEQFFNILSLANLNIELTSPECSVDFFGDPWLIKWVLMLMLPIFMVFLLGVTFVLGLLYRLFARTYGAKWADRHPSYFPGAENFFDAGGKASRSTLIKFRIGRLMSEAPLTPAALRQAVVRTFFQLFIFCYLPLTAVVLRYFECERRAPGSSEYVLATAPSVECYDATYWSLFWMAIAGSIVYALGIPLFTYLLLYFRKRQMAEVNFMLRYGFLVARFREKLYYFEITIMIRKLLVVGAVVAFGSPVQEAVMAALVLVISFGFVAHATPYLKPFHNRLAMSALFTSCIVLIGGTVDSNGLRDTLVLGGLGANIFVIVYGIVVETKNLIIREAEDMVEVLELQDTFEMGTFTINEDEDTSMHYMVPTDDGNGKPPAGGMAKPADSIVVSSSTDDNTSMVTASMVSSSALHPSESIFPSFALECDTAPPVILPPGPPSPVSPVAPAMPAMPPPPAPAPPPPPPAPAAALPPPTPSMVAGVPPGGSLPPPPSSTNQPVVGPGGLVAPLPPPKAALPPPPVGHGPPKPSRPKPSAHAGPPIPAPKPSGTSAAPFPPPKPY